MATAVLYLLLLVQTQRIFGIGILLQSRDCGPDLIAYSNADGQELFYINENTVNRISFCKALQFYHTKGCNFKDFLGTSCAPDLSPEHFPLREGRKLLLEDFSHKAIFQSQKNFASPSSTTKIAIAASGALLVCCAFLCPCIYKKRKTAAHAVLAKDPHSMDSTSSYEANSASEKVSTSEKVPASPLRVPPSPSRFYQSPRLSRLGSVHLNLNQVTRATQNFSPDLLIGEGGFGNVYKAQLEGGQVVAIKRAKKEHFENLRTEFSSEVELLAKIDHRNLVKLLGYIDRGSERLIITEYVPNGTLREHLDGVRGKILDFNQRLEISIDVAHALTYLHLYAEKQIIHRDVKSSNILLTESMRAKVADFGFARVGPGDANQTHISTKVKGTVGYLDPEYMKTYQLTPKSDVYSFGILLLEIVTGRRPVEPKRSLDERVTLRWVNSYYMVILYSLGKFSSMFTYICCFHYWTRPAGKTESWQAFREFREGSVVELVDPLMEEVVDAEILVSMVDLAFRCAAPIRADRPDMKIVGEQLWAIRADYLKRARRASS